MQGLNFVLLDELEKALNVKGMTTERVSFPRKNSSSKKNPYSCISLKMHLSRKRAIYVAYHYFGKWSRNVFGLNMKIVDRNPKLFQNNHLKTEVKKTATFWYGELTEDVYSHLLDHLLSTACDLHAQRKQSQQ